MKTVVLQASARSQGDTSLVVNHLASLMELDRLDIKDYNISPYSYEDDYPINDNYYELIAQLLEYDLIIFATPVYWYTMSGRLKIFFDRITDLLKQKKELGRALRGKSMALVSCSNDNELTDHFSNPFTHTAAYLGMHFLAEVHVWSENKLIDKQAKENLKEFVIKIT